MGGLDKLQQYDTVLPGPGGVSWSCHTRSENLFWETSYADLDPNTTNKLCNYFWPKQFKISKGYPNIQALKRLEST